MNPSADFDVAVVGAGPAGCAAAISCRKAGLRVVIIEGQPFPRFRPGETLHPGAEVLLDQLGVGAAVRKRTPIRFPGIWIGSENRRTFSAFGYDAQGTWLGFQVERAALDFILSQQALSLGAVLLQPCYVTAVKRQTTQWVINTRSGQVRASLIVDATGSARSIANCLGLKTIAHSTRMIAQYGYGCGRAAQNFDCPSFTASKNGWLWIAKVEPKKYQWIRTSWDPNSDTDLRLPTGVLHLEGILRTHGADVTWRLLDKPATSGYFAVGDAAAVLDPSSSSGVIRALATGIMAAHLAQCVIQQRNHLSAVTASYNRWLRNWFLRDVRGLRAAYRCSPPQ
jgi:flavin-dependent dehydrogenase